MSEKSRQTNPLPKKAWISISLLSAVFVGGYFVLRALPDAECGFLHYEEIVNANGEIELCATNHAGFLDLTRLKYPIETELRVGDKLEVGQPAKVELSLETSGGMSIAPYELAVTHTEKMHVMVIDPSLEDYHHVHPEAEGMEGTYQFDFTPARAGAYRVFTEIVPLRSRRQAIAYSEIEVPGEAQKATFAQSTQYEVNGVQFELVGIPDEIETGRDYRFELQVMDQEGRAVALETVMGAKGHMVAFDSEGTGFAHMHPIDSIAAVRTAGISSSASEDDTLAFLFNVPNAGWYRVFAQIQLDGAPVFGRFDINVK